MKSERKKLERVFAVVTILIILQRSHITPICSCTAQNLAIPMALGSYEIWAGLD